MDTDQCLQDGRDAIGRSLSDHIAIERETPDHLIILLRRLRLSDQELARKRARGDR